MNGSSIELSNDCLPAVDFAEPEASSYSERAGLVEVIRDVASFHDLKEEWNALLETSASRCLFLTWEWLYTWWKHLSGGRALSILVVRSNGKLVAIAPFAIKTRRFALALPVRIIEFLGTGTVSSDHLDLIIRPGSEEEAIRALAGHLVERRIAVKLVHFNRGSSFVLQLAAQLRSRGWTGSEDTVVRAPFIRLSGHTWESYLETLSGDHRREIRRRLGKVNKEFEVRTEEAVTEEERARFLSLLFALHDERWRERGGSQAFSKPAVRAFHEEVTALMLQRGCLRLFVQWFDGKPAGSRYGFRYGRTYYSYQGGFDPAYARHGLGILNFALAIKNSIDEGVDEHDLLAGNDEYKNRLAPEVRELGRLELYPPGAGWLLYRRALTSYRAGRSWWSRAVTRVGGIARRVTAAFPLAAARTSTGEGVKLMKFVTSLGVAGTERQSVELGLSLEPSRFAVHFASMHRWGQLHKTIEACRVPVLHYPVSTFRHPRVLAAQFRLARDIRRRGIQIVHTYGFYANVFAIPAAKLAGARVIASIRDMGVYLTPSQRLVQRLICGFADRILVNAGAIRDWLVADGYDATRITVIPNGIDLTRFEQSAQTGSLHRELGLPGDAPLIGVAGRVAPLKGIDDFLRAASIVVRRFPAARFLIVGDAGLYVWRDGALVEDDRHVQELKRLAADLGLQDRVIFTGFRPDIEHVLSELTVSVQPSLSEGMSNTLLESMAAGVPIVATRVGGAAEAVRHGENGLLVLPGDPDTMAAAICRLLAEPAFASELGAGARRSIAENYSLARVVERTSLLYESLLPRKTRPAMHSSPTTI